MNDARPNPAGVAQTLAQDGAAGAVLGKLALKFWAGFSRRHKLRAVPDGARS